MLTQYITDGLALLGAAYTIASILATALPASKIQAFFAKIAVDLTDLKNSPEVKDLTDVSNVPDVKTDIADVKKDL